MTITAAEKHSKTLFELISSEIALYGKMTFARYMELALYAPGLGYYSTGTKKFGAEGDFITAPEISPLFSRCLAKQCQPVLTFLKNADILELGAGTGVMAAALLLELEKLNVLPSHYFILDLSADLKERQYHTFQKQIPHLLSRIQWISSLPSSFTGIILANEVADALPVHRFYKEENKISEFYVQLENQKLSWHLDAPSSETLISAVQTLPANLSDYVSEINLLLPGWIKSLSHSLSKGLILLIDYGFPRHEYYHPHRNRGTLMCHYRHRAHPDPFFLPGLQDITAHVDFTLLAESATQSGLTVNGYTTQSAFLLGSDITEFALPPDENPREALKISQQIKLLTLESEMGELFKVMGLTKQLDIPLRGFTYKDMRHRL